MSLRLIHFYNFYLGIINWNKKKSGKLSFLSLNFKKKTISYFWDNVIITQ